LISYRVRLFIFQCRDIPAADDNGLSDCYIKVWNNSEKEIRSKTTCEETLNPVFYETLEFFYDMGNTLESCPPLLINLWDKDPVIKLTGDDFLGMALLHLNKPQDNVVNILDPKYQSDNKKNLNQPASTLWNEVKSLTKQQE